jgi:hypothetical protein
MAFFELGNYGFSVLCINEEIVRTGLIVNWAIGLGGVVVAIAKWS